MAARDVSAPFPWGLRLALGGWYAQASALLLAGLAVRSTAGPGALLPGAAVGSRTVAPSGVLLVGLALLSVVALVLLGLGHAFAVVGLVALGALGTWVLSASGSWGALVVPLAMVLGLLPLLGTRTSEHLRSRGHR